MTKLLKRVREIPEENPKPVCSSCHSIILQSRENEAIWWCPVCGAWTNPKGIKITGGKIIWRSMEAMARSRTGKVDKQQIKFQKEMALTVKTYSSEEYEQEFLQSLIPKR